MSKQKPWGRANSVEEFRHALVESGEVAAEDADALEIYEIPQADVVDFLQRMGLTDAEISEQLGLMGVLQ